MRNRAESDSDLLALSKDIDSKPADSTQGDREVDVEIVFESLALLFREDVESYLSHFCRGQIRCAIEFSQCSIDAQNRCFSCLEVYVRRTKGETCPAKRSQAHLAHQAL